MTKRKNILGHPKSAKTEAFWKASCARVKTQIVSPKLKNMTHAFFNLYDNEESLWKRYSKSFAYTLENEPVVLFDHEYLVGMLYHVDHRNNDDLKD